LTTSKVTVIVWRSRGNIIRTVLYIANVLPLQWAQLTKTVHTARLGLEFVVLGFFRLHDLSLCWCMCVLFYLGQLSHFPSCCGAGVTNLNEPPSSFLLPSHYCRLGAGSTHPFKGHCEQKSNARRGGYICRWSSTTE